MSATDFLSSSFRFAQLKGASDVQSIIDLFAAEVAANAPGWTNPSQNLFKSPPDTVGRWFDVLLTRVTQWKLECRVRDALGVTIATRRITGLPSANNWMVNIFTGQMHFEIDVFPMSAAPQHMGGGLLDLSPESQLAHTHNVYARGWADSSDTANYTDVQYAFMVDNVTATYYQRTFLYLGNIATGGYPRMTPNGNRVFRPVEYFCVPTGGSSNRYYAGRAYQQLLCYDNIEFGAKIVVPISPLQSGVFRVSAIPATYNGRVCIRVA